jgi:hypothetical protein
MSRLLCAEPQRMAVIAMLGEVGIQPRPLWLHSVRSPGDMAGLEGGTFIIVENHSTPVDPCILEAVRVYGLVEWRLNDDNARARHARRFSEPALRQGCGLLNGRL